MQTLFIYRPINRVAIIADCGKSHFDTAIRLAPFYRAGNIALIAGECTTKQGKSDGFDDRGFT